MKVKGHRRTTKAGKVAQVREFERRGLAARGKEPPPQQQAEEEEGPPAAENKYVQQAAGMMVSALIRAGLKKGPNGWVGFEKIDYRKVAHKMKAKVKGMKPDDPRYQAVRRILKDLKALNDKYGDGRGLKEPEPEQEEPQEEGQEPGQEASQEKEQVPQKQAAKAVEEDTEEDNEGDEEEPDQTPKVKPEEYIKEFQGHVVSVQRKKYETFVSYKAEKFGDRLISEGLNDYIVAMSDLVKALFSDDPTVAYMIRAEHDRHGENVLKRVLARIGSVPYMVEPIAMSVKDAKGHLVEKVKGEQVEASVGRRYMYCLGFKPESPNQAKALMRVLVQAAKRGTGREVDGHSSRQPFIISNVLDELPGAALLKLYAKKFGNQMVLSVNKGSEGVWDREDKALVYAKGPIST